MDIHAGGMPFHRLQHPQVGHDKSIHACTGCIFYGFRQAVCLGIGGQRVHGKIHLFAAGMGIHTALGQLLHREVLRSRAHTELRQRTVNGIRTKAEGILQFFQIPSRGKQFRNRQHNFFLLFTSV